LAILHSFKVPDYAKETLRKAAGIHQAIWSKWNLKIPDQEKLVVSLRLCVGGVAHVSPIV
jgi:hypothetical protein